MEYVHLKAKAKEQNKLTLISPGLATLLTNNEKSCSNHKIISFDTGTSKGGSDIWKNQIYSKRGRLLYIQWESNWCNKRSIQLQRRKNTVLDKQIRHRNIRTNRCRGYRKIISNNSNNSKQKNFQKVKGNNKNNQPQNSVMVLTFIRKRTKALRRRSLITRGDEDLRQQKS